MMGSATANLQSLPDDLILDIVNRLNTARDVAHVASASQRFRNFVQHHGWRTFVKAGFPSLRIPSNQATRWQDMANRLTYLDQCWEKRAFLIHEYSELRYAGRRNQRQQHHQPPLGRQSVSFHPVLDARLLSSLDEELVAWGAGEELLVRVNPASGLDADLKTAQWYRLDGQMSGYTGGFGDVTALSILERHDVPEILVGRANGHLQLVSASGPQFGRVVQSLHSPEDASQKPYYSRKSPGQMAITWTEWEPTNNIVASCRHSTLTLYDVNDRDAATLKPITSYDLSQDSAADETSLLRSVKFLSSDVVACALGDAREPVRWAKLTPTGPEFYMAAKGPDPVDYLSTKTESTRGARTVVRAIETVGRAHNEHLLLCAWEDGTYRLNDVRTSSPHDVIYRDRWEVYEEGSSLLVYGTHHFVAGSNRSTSVRFFDFRYPKPYHYTDALACSSEPPHPPPPRERDQGWLPPTYYDVCDDRHGMTCAWHAQSREDYWRPDTTLHLGRRGYDRVHALAKASDVSGSFFCGLPGSILEMSLKQAEHVTTQNMKRDAPPGWRVGPSSSEPAVVETGVALCRENEWGQQDSGYPELWKQPKRTPLAMRQPGAVSRSRYDTSYLHYRHHSES